MKLSLIGQIVVGVSIAVGGIVTPLIQNMQSQSTGQQFSETTLRLTLEELAFFDGQNGRKAYIAFEFDLYDVTNASGWENGFHEGMHLAGKDCSEILKSSPHGTSVLAQLTIIGELITADLTSSQTPNSTTSLTTVTSSTNTGVTSNSEVCVWVSTDDAFKFNEDDDDDDHDEDDDDDYDEDDEDGFWSCTDSGNTPPSSATTTSSTNGNYPNTPSTDGKYYLTLAELSYYDGTNGKPAWIAVYGKLYDVTNTSGWKNGVHRGMHLAGKDASSAFDDSPHSQSLLNSLLHIGFLLNA